MKCYSLLSGSHLITVIPFHKDTSNFVGFRPLSYLRLYATFWILSCYDNITYHDGKTGTVFFFESWICIAHQEAVIDINFINLIA